MEKQDFTTTILVDQTPTHAFNAINNVREWWSKNVDGNTEKLNDVFTYLSRDTWVTFKIIESVTDKKIVWRVTDCYLPSFKDKTEWKNTDVVFEISEHENSTQINFTHIGLVPEVECYNACIKGWTQYVTVSLLNLLSKGKGQPAEIKFWENIT